MINKVIENNKYLMRSLRSKFNESKNDLSAFTTLWKYIQNKEKSQKIQDTKIN